MFNPRTPRVCLLGICEVCLAWMLDFWDSWVFLLKGIDEQEWHKWAFLRSPFPKIINFPHVPTSTWSCFSESIPKCDDACYLSECNYSLFWNRKLLQSCPTSCMANKAQEHCCFVGNAIYLKFSLFHFLCQFRNATSGTITTSTNNSLRSKEYTVWVILTFWKSTWCKFSDHFFPSFPHMRVSLVPEKQKLKFYCLTTVFSFNCSNESANLKTSVKNTEEFLKEPPSWSGIYRYIFH